MIFYYLSTKEEAEFNFLFVEFVVLDFLLIVHNSH